MDIFRPKKLEAAKDYIKSVHKEVGQERELESNSETLRNLVFKIVMLEESKLASFSYTLNKTELNTLAGYIFTNQFGVDVSNIVDLLRIRCNDNIIQKVYVTWQRVFDNEAKTKRPLEKIAEDKILLKAIEDLSEFSFVNISKATSASDVLSYLKKDLKIEKLAGYEEYTEKLKHHAIEFNTRLGRVLLDMFYCYCDRRAFENLQNEAHGIQKLYDIVKNGDVEVQLGILKNMLLELPIESLAEFDILVPLFLKRTGYYGSSGFDASLQDVNEKDIRKYRTWINDSTFEDIFGHDANTDRKMFWKRYASQCDAERISQHDMVVMKFGSFVVIESKVMGAIYWYSTEYYLSWVKPYFKYKTSELKSWMKNVSAFHERRTHNGYWQNPASQITASLLRR